MTKRLCHRSWLVQEDGSYTPVDVPGPSSLDAWEACFGVHEVCRLMLTYPDLHHVANLEIYLLHFRRLAKGQPEAWHMRQLAADKCKAEHFPRFRR